MFQKWTVTRVHRGRTDRPRSSIMVDQPAQGLPSSDANGNQQTADCIAGPTTISKAGSYCICRASDHTGGIPSVDYVVARHYMLGRYILISFIYYMFLNIKKRTHANQSGA